MSLLFSRGKVALTQLKKMSLRCCKVIVWAAHTVHGQQTICHKISRRLLQGPWCGGSPPEQDKEFLEPSLWKYMQSILYHSWNLWPKYDRVLPEYWSLFLLWICMVNLRFLALPLVPLITHHWRQDGRLLSSATACFYVVWLSLPHSKLLI